MDVCAAAQGRRPLEGVKMKDDLEDGMDPSLRMIRLIVTAAAAAATPIVFFIATTAAIYSSNILPEMRQGWDVMCTRVHTWDRHMQ